MVSQIDTFEPGTYWTSERQSASAEWMAATLASPEMRAIFAAIAESGGPPAEGPTVPSAPAADLTGITREALTYRRGSEDDIAGITALLEIADLPPLFIEEWLGGFVIAEFNGQMAGCGGLEMYGDSGVLRSIVIDERARGLGLGRSMSELLIEDGRRSGATDMYLFTADAHPFWMRLGFADVSLPDWKEPARACWQHQFLSRYGDTFDQTVYSMWRAV